MNQEDDALFNLQELSELEADARKICRLLDNCNFNDALYNIKKHRNLLSHERIQNVLHGYFDTAGEIVAQNTLVNEARLIHSIFPNVTIYHITNMLTDFAGEANRIQNVLKKLLLFAKIEDRQQYHRLHELLPPDKRVKLPRKPFNNKPATITSYGSAQNRTYTNTLLNINYLDRNTTETPSSEVLYCRRQNRPEYILPSSELRRYDADVSHEHHPNLIIFRASQSHKSTQTDSADMLLLHILDLASETTIRPTPGCTQRPRIEFRGYGKDTSLTGLKSLEKCTQTNFEEPIQSRLPETNSQNAVGIRVRSATSLLLPNDCYTHSTQEMLSVPEVGSTNTTDPFKTIRRYKREEVGSTERDSEDENSNTMENPELSGNGFAGFKQEQTDLQSNSQDTDAEDDGNLRTTTIDKKPKLLDIKFLQQQEPERFFKDNCPVIKAENIEPPFKGFICFKQEPTYSPTVELKRCSRNKLEHPICVSMQLLPYKQQIFRQAEAQIDLNDNVASIKFESPRGYKKEQIRLQPVATKGYNLRSCNSAEDTVDYVQPVNASASKSNMPPLTPTQPTDFNIDNDEDFVQFISATKRSADDMPGPSKVRKIEPANQDGYDLQKQLEEILAYSPPGRIRNVRRKHWHNRFQQPPDAIFDTIMSDLLAESVKKDTLKMKNDNARSLRITASLSNNGTRSSKIPIKRPNSTDSLKCTYSEDEEHQPYTNDVPTTPDIDEVGVYDNMPPQAKHKLHTREKYPHHGDVVVVDDIEDDNDDKKIVFKPVEKNQKPLAYRIMEIFPDACPRYTHTICNAVNNNTAMMDDLITHMLEVNYPKRAKANSPQHFINADEQLDFLTQVLPDADPDYLKAQCEQLFEKPDEFKAFVSRSLEKRDYPTTKDSLKKQEISSQQKQYTTEFNVEKFLEVIPDPFTYFDRSNKRPVCTKVDDIHYAICFLRNHFPRVQLHKIREVFRNKGSSLIETCEALQLLSASKLMKAKRNVASMPKLIKDIPILQEIAFIEHRFEIMKFVEERKNKEKLERETAKANGLLQTCSCCYDDEVMLKDIYSCQNDCIFCKECVRKFVEINFAEGKLDFQCLGNCTSGFSLQTLQAVLNPKMFSVIALRKQLEEVKAAGIEDLETCPFCDFANIPLRDDKLFRCLNPECMKESCRLCREPSHVPLRCEEVEKEDDVQRRTYIENKMTEALLRKCHRCGLKFIKADGCNKMTCSCGAMMCYVCGEAVTDYKHFNGVGGDNFHLCPLYSDTNKLHEEAVLKGASKAKREIGADRDPSKLKIDPAVDVKHHYLEQAEINPEPPIPQYVNPFVFIPPLNQRAVMVNPERHMRQRDHREGNGIFNIMGIRNRYARQHQLRQLQRGRY